METEEVKFEMVKKVLGVDPLGSKCTFCLASPEEKCKDINYKEINMPHAIRWTAELNKDKPVVMKKYMVNANVKGIKFIGRFEAKSKTEAIRMAENSDKCHTILCDKCISECQHAEVYDFYAVEIE